MRLRLRLRARALTDSASTTFEVVVLGAGPAGCAAAALLARRSHRVALVAPERPPAPELAESVPPSARRILEELGFLDAVREAGLHPNRGNTAWWSGGEARVEAFPEDRIGVHTDRARLERTLRSAADRAGAHDLGPLTARGATEIDGGWRIRCTDEGGEEHVLHAAWVVDATGRHGLLARREGRVPDRATTTVALVRRYRREGGWSDAYRGHTLVESYPDGWAWSLPLSEEVRCFTVMIDQRETPLTGTGVAAMLEAELGRAPHLHALLEGAAPVGSAWACPASLYASDRYARRGLVLAGDAGSFIDPLSSFGVKKALSSGWLAGIAIHTALTDPEMADVAMDFFDAREQAVYRSFRASSHAFFAEAAEAYGTEYWSRRAEAARQGDAPVPEAGSTTAGTGTGSDLATHPPDPLEPPLPEDDVRAAFDVIRSAAVLRARPGRSLRSVERACVEGDRLVLRPHLASDRLPHGLRYVRDVDLSALVEVAPRHGDVPEGWTAYNDAAPPVSLPDYLTALATAFAAGFLEHDVGAPR